MKISRRVVEQVRLESRLNTTLFTEMDKLRKEGYRFKPLKSYMGMDYQNVSYTTGEKEVEWVEDKE